MVITVYNHNNDNEWKFKQIRLRTHKKGEMLGVFIVWFSEKIYLIVA